MRYNKDNKFSILVVDDDHMIRKATSIILKEAGYEVIEAENGKRCLEMVRAFHPDLVLLDVIMPDKNGLLSAEPL